MIASQDVTDPHDCAMACLGTNGCKSYNYQEVGSPLHVCQLSSQSKSSAAADHVPDTGFWYFDADEYVSMDRQTARELGHLFHVILFYIYCIFFWLECSLNLCIFIISLLKLIDKTVLSLSTSFQHWISSFNKQTNSWLISTLFQYFTIFQ